MPTVTAAQQAAGVAGVKKPVQQWLQDRKAWLGKVIQAREAKLKEWVHKKALPAWVENAFELGADIGSNAPNCGHCDSACGGSGMFLDTDWCWSLSFPEKIVKAAFRQCKCLTYTGYKRGAAALPKTITPKDLGVSG
jgi:hypothetical protein